MELEQIRQISLVGFLEDMGHIPVSRKGNDVWFRSPFRNERSASFKVDTQRNVWFDFGIGKGGDIFHLAGELTGSTGFMEQLEFLSGKSGILPLRPLQERKKIPRVSGFEDVKVTELSHEALKSYLKERGIDPAIAGRFCKEVAYGIRVMNSVTRCSRDASLPRTFPMCPCPERNRIRAVCLKDLWISFRHWYCGLWRTRTAWC